MITRDLKNFVLSAICLLSLLAPAHAEQLITSQGNQPSLNLNDVEWELVPLTDSDGNIRQVLVLKGAASRVGIFTSKPSHSLSVGGTIEAEQGFVFPDGTKQMTASARGPQGEVGPAGPAGPEGPAGPATNLTTSAICVHGSNSPGICSCSNNMVSRVESPCTATSDTGPCDAATDAASGSKGSCCVCH